MKTVHELKIKPEYWNNLRWGKKRSEVRYNDRDFQVGDFVMHTDLKGIPLPSAIQLEIGHIHSGLGMADNYVILSYITNFNS